MNKPDNFFVAFHEDKPMLTSQGSIRIYKSFDSAQRFISSRPRFGCTSVVEFTPVSVYVPNNETNKLNESFLFDIDD